MPCSSFDKINNYEKEEKKGLWFLFFLNLVKVALTSLGSWSNTVAESFLFNLLWINLKYNKTIGKSLRFLIDFFENLWRNASAELCLNRYLLLLMKHSLVEMKCTYLVQLMQPMDVRCLMEKSHSVPFFDVFSAKFKEHAGNLPFHVLNF